MIGALCGCLPGQNPFSRGVGRRQAFRATGIGFVTTLSGILSGAGRVTRAQPAAGRVPVVDRLSVRIVTGHLHRSLRGITRDGPGQD